MSEHKTISGLVTLLTAYPEAAPEGLAEFLREWADVAISRSDNLWDFRKLQRQALEPSPVRCPG